MPKHPQRNPRDVSAAVPLEKPPTENHLDSDNARSWTIAFAILAVLLVTLTWFPLVRLAASYEMGPNEGFNAYFQQTAVSGGQVYGQPPEFYYANYPPLSFHLVGWLGRLTGNVNVAGRVVSLIAYLMIGLLTGLAVQRLTGSRRYGAYAALCWLIWLAAFDMNRIGFNDPHLLGIALNLAAFYCFLRDPESPKSLAASALLFALSLFAKHTLLAFPAAVAIQLFLTDRKRLWRWLAIAVAASLAFLVLTWLVDGRYFLDHLGLPRTYSLAGVTGNAATYFTFICVAFVAALMWILGNRSSGRAGVLIWSFAIAHLLGLVYCAGDGAAANHFFDAMVVTAMIIGLLLPRLEIIVKKWTFPATALTILLIVPFFLTCILGLPQRVPLDIARYSIGIPALQIEFSNAVKLIRSQPGPALCENLLLCYEAGKPETYDAFAVDQAIKTGHLAESRVLQLLAQRHYGIVQIEVAQSEALRPVARHRFSAAFMTQLLATYRLAARSSRHALFVPNPSIPNQSRDR